MRPKDIEEKKKLRKKSGVLYNRKEVIKEQEMFQKKEVIFSESIGPCQVEDIVKLAAQKNAVPVQYYVLRSVTDKKKVSYIPVENHRFLLRPLITAQEAEAFLGRQEEEKDEKLCAEAAFVLGRAQK